MKGSVKWLETRAFLDYMDYEIDDETTTYGSGFQ